jgi:hypothetical protein
MPQSHKVTKKKTHKSSKLSFEKMELDRFLILIRTLRLRAFMAEFAKHK